VRTIDVIALVIAVLYVLIFARRSALRASYRRTHFARDDSGGLLFAPLGLTSVLFRRTYRVANDQAAERLLDAWSRWGAAGMALSLAMIVVLVGLVHSGGEMFGVYRSIVGAGLLILAVVVLFVFPMVGILLGAAGLPVTRARTLRDVLSAQERFAGSAWVAWAWSAMNIGVAIAIFVIVRGDAGGQPELVTIAWVGSILSLLAAALGPVLLKFRSMRLENERLEVTVAERTEEIRLANAALAQRAEELAATNARVVAQAEELAQWNAKLEERVAEQVEKLEALGRLKRFLSPRVAELIAAGHLDDPLATRRREVAIVFVDLRGFTAFSDTAEPEDVMGVLREYHAEVGRLVNKYDGTIEHFAGDGVMVIFNDPAPLPDPALAAVRMSVELRDSVARLAESWSRLGHQLGCGLGIAQGFATIGTIGFEGRHDYGVIGATSNLSARLCAQAAAGQVLVSQRVFGRVEDKIVAESVGDLTLKGLRTPVPAYNVVSMKAVAAEDAAPLVGTSRI